VFIVNDEVLTEEMRIQLLNKEIVNQYNEAGLKYPEIIPKEVAEAAEEQYIMSLIKQREEIQKARQIEELIANKSNRDKNGEYVTYIKR
jgi:hypothetical protein